MPATCFPRSYIWFGVLHAVAVALVLARPLIPFPRASLAIGILVIVAGLALSHPAFDNRALGWLGFMTAKPSTEDYVPLFPWAGALLCGVASDTRSSASAPPPRHSRPHRRGSSGRAATR